MVNYRTTCAILAVALGAVSAAPTTARSGEASSFRDLNHNGRLDAYEDVRLPVARRVEDLLARMTLEEKVGLMLHGTLPAPGSPIGSSDTGYDLIAVGALVGKAHINSFITRLEMPAAAFAAQNNAVQRLAEQSRLGIPVTISTDPRSHFQAVFGTSNAAGGFSRWPETLGFGALGDAASARLFGRRVAAEYRAVGIQMALSPQADLFTEPRWPRGTGTFGSDPATVSRLAGAYVEGFQGGSDGVRPSGVATVVKHWVGYGAEPEGFDGHNHYGRVARLSDRSFALHVSAFDGALRAKSAGVMPTYPILAGVTLDGKPLEPVGAGFSKQLLGDLLRRRKGYDGLIVSDWAITNDCVDTCVAPTAERPQVPPAIGMPWGVETLGKEDRYAKGANAGIDQFGGINDPSPLLAAARAGKIGTARIDDAARRVLRLKFALGLFDNPYVDAAAASRIVGNATTQAEADALQRAAHVVLENRSALLPLVGARRVWLSGVDPVAARAVGLTVVDRPEDAQIAIVRTATPFERLHPHHFFGGKQNEGRLDFRDGDPGYEAIKRAAATGRPVIVAVDMDRPAILTNVRDKATAIVAVFGASDGALLDVLTGRAAPRGRLPFELPSSMAAVQAQDPALPDDSRDPLYPRGYGLTLNQRR